jgi:hypothetical protein
MADQKISQLTPYTSSEIIAGDLFAVVDTANAQTKNMTLEELGSSLINTTDLLSRSGGALTGDLFFPDDIKAGFGDGSDLEIYHDGTYSYVGSLKFDADGYIVDPVTINAALNVGGTVTATGLDMNGNADFGGNITLSQADSATIKRSDNTGLFSLQGGTDALSTSLVMYGNAHATLSNWTILEGDTMVFRSVDNTDFMRFIDGTGTIFNETGADHDFRIESDTNTHAFFLRGDNGKVGIGDSDPPTILSVRGDTPESRITNTNAISDTGGTEEVARLGVYGQRNTVYGPAANIVFRQDAASWSSVEAYQKGTRIEFCTQDATATDTSETPRMVINKDGKVGIGTSSPTEKLHLSQDSAFTIQMERTGDNPSVCKIANSGNLLNISQNVSGIVFLTGTTPEEAVRIEADGDVGIGTDSPQARLDVTDATGNQLVVGTNTNASGTEAGILFKHDTNNNNREGGGIRSVRNGSTTDFGLALDVGVNGVSTQAMFISGVDTTPGYVGIGTSSPAEKLEIATNDQSSILRLTDTATIGAVDRKVGGIEFYQSDASGGAAVNSSIESYHANISGATDLRFSTGDNSERMRITSGGSVGIGTSSPQTDLHVDAGTKNYTDTTPGLGSYAVSIESGSTGTCGIGIGSHNNTPSIQGFGGGTAYNVALCPANGSVAIGHTSPSAKLDVNGTAKAKSYVETYVTLSGTTPTITCTDGNFFGLNTTGNTTFTFASAPASGTGYGFSLRLTAGGTHTLTWPASVKWPGGTAPDNPASGETNIYAFVTHDGGTTWYGMVGGEAFA